MAERNSKKISDIFVLKTPKRNFHVLTPEKNFFEEVFEIFKS